MKFFSETFEYCSHGFILLTRTAKVCRETLAKDEAGVQACESALTKMFAQHMEDNVSELALLVFYSLFFVPFN